MIDCILDAIEDALLLGIYGELPDHLTALPDEPFGEVPSKTSGCTGGFSRRDLTVAREEGLLKFNWKGFQRGRAGRGFR